VKSEERLGEAGEGVGADGNSAAVPQPHHSLLVGDAVILGKGTHRCVHSYAQLVGADVVGAVEGVL